MTTIRPERSEESKPNFLSPAAKCDLIMQGGITSGVVYPGAVLRLATHYRFCSIGGTSAGAIAAAATAAAELDRSGGGFDRLAELPTRLGECLLSLFQPTSNFSGVFAIFLSNLGPQSVFKKIPRILVVTVTSFPLTLLAGLVPILIYIARTWHNPRTGYSWEDWTIEAVCVTVAAIVGMFLAALMRLLLLVLRDLPRALFGVCPGLRQGNNPKPALTEWLADLLDDLAGFEINAPSESRKELLTFGHLDAAQIELKMMTTNLSARRPYTLPFVTHPVRADHDGRYAYNEKEWSAFFPPRVMRSLQQNTSEVNNYQGYRYLPEAKHLPVIVAVRMSLSFPMLLSAIPLYRQDWTYNTPEERHLLRRCIFSDGGISSNFPIHFFDNLLPTRPTFAIALDDYSPLRSKSNLPQDRVTMPKGAHEGFLLPVAPVQSLPSFVAAIVNSARNWQDNLQRILSGYRERIAEVALLKAEGGLNLNMDEELIDRLNDLGTLAGDHMLDFDLKEHQWRRFLVSYARLEETFEHMNESYTAGFESFLDSYPPNTESYTPNAVWFTEVHSRVKTLLALTAPWRAAPLRTRGKIPKPDTNLRITPKP